MLSPREQNQKDVLEYLDYCDTARQNCRETVLQRKRQLGYLSDWAGDVPFSNATLIKKSYPAHLSSLKKPDSTERILCTSSIHATLNVSRMFFQWAISAFPERYENITSTWIESLRTPRNLKNSELVKAHQYYSLEDMLKIAKLKPETLAEKRGQAAMCFLYLTGMRCMRPNYVVVNRLFRLNYMMVLGMVNIFK